MGKLSVSLTIRVISFLAFALSLVSCMGQGADQIHGMVNVNFSSTAVCQAQEKDIHFQNISGEEIVIEGAAISGGTDPDGNFKLLGVTVGSNPPVDASANAVHDIHVPPGVNYSFQVSYVPRIENQNQNAVIDIAYTAPREGVIQVSLSGISTSRAPNCPTTGGGTKTGVGDLNGDLSITVNRIALVTDKLQAPISTDIHTAHPFVEPTLPVTFNSSANTIILKAIPDSANFKLPPTLDPPLSTTITQDTVVTSTADAPGIYADDGSISISNVPIHLAEKFHADFVVTLTTAQLDIPNIITKSLLDDAGFTLTTDRAKIFGSPIDATTKKVILIGISTFSNPGGTGTVATTIGGGTGAVIIEATVNTTP